MGNLQRVAIIGAGISGLTCAKAFGRLGIETTVFDKSRGVGGRVATRRTDSGAPFDHGAQYFTARDPIFAAQVKQWCADGAAGIWPGRVVKLREGVVLEWEKQRERYVGVPAMNEIAKSLGKGLDVRMNTTVQSLLRLGDHWQLNDSAGICHGPYDMVISSAPPEQTRTIFGQHSVKIRHEMTTVKMEPCWAVMLQLPEPLDLPFDAAFVQDSPLSWIARNSSKPGRGEFENWVLHASPSWSIENLEQPAQIIAQSLTEQFWKVTRHPPLPATATTTHRWRYARPLEPLKQRCLIDRNAKLGACGDWCGGDRVESAYLSGLAVAEAVLQDI